MIISLTIDRFEGDQAVLIAADGTNIIWPKTKLPDGVKEGSVLTITISPDRQEENAKKQKAKDILNEILNTDNNTPK